jgi:hypothetical protein
MIVRDETNGVSACVMWDGAIGCEVGGLFAIWAAIGTFIAMPGVVFHLALGHQGSIEENSSPLLVSSFEACLFPNGTRIWHASCWAVRAYTWFLLFALALAVNTCKN